MPANKGEFADEQRFLPARSPINRRRLCTPATFSTTAKRSHWRNRFRCAPVPFPSSMKMATCATSSSATIEIVRRIYAAVRDPNWGTPPNRLANVQMEIAADHFQIQYDVTNVAGEIDFAWRGVIRGAADGTITFSMDGVARSTFLRNRLGFCVLHPAECAGQRVRIEHVDGAVEESAFPRSIAPQRIENGQIKPVAPFHELAALAHEVEPGVWAELRFHGEIFELEDQRNWTDASYKTYCTPLRLPFPVEVAAGTHVTQSITLKLLGARLSSGLTCTRTPTPLWWTPERDARCRS